LRQPDARIDDALLHQIENILAKSLNRCLSATIARMIGLLVNGASLGKLPIIKQLLPKIIPLLTDDADATVADIVNLGQFSRLLSFHGNTS
jgi:hypothetical protein